MAKQKLMIEVNAALQKVGRASAQVAAVAAKNPTQPDAKALANAARDLHNHREQLAKAVRAADAHIQSYDKESIFKSARNVFQPKLKTARQDFTRSTAAASLVNTHAAAIVHSVETIIGHHV